MLRIIGGRHRGRRLETEPGSRVRPTADRVREAVFNKLMHGLVSEGGAALTGVRVVDVFAGTGAMGLGALSRQAPAEAHGLVFLDAPYRSGLTDSALTALAREGWIAPGAVAVAERAAKEDLRTPGGFALIDERRYGAAKVAFLRYEGNAEQTHTSTSSA